MADDQLDVAQRIRNDIVNGVLQFGARITMDDLATRYGVSHMPVREALRELHGEGLVVFEPNRGARVCSFDSNSVSNLFEMRSALEVMLVQRAAQRCTAADVVELNAIQDRIEANIAAGAYPEVLAGNHEFHQAINRIANNPDALAIVNRHWTLLAALWRYYGYGEERFSGVANDHRHLIRALELRDIQAASAIMAAHVTKAKLVLEGKVLADEEQAAKKNKVSKRRSV